MREEEFYDVSDGFTFKKLWSFLKMALPYILVCLVIVVMIGIAGCGILSEVGKSGGEKVRAIFELTYFGADEGLSPDKKPLDTQKVKSIGRITEALGTHGLNFSSTEIQNAITINGYYSPAMREIIDKLNGDEKKALEIINKIKLYPTQFVMNFNYKAVSGLSSNQAMIIVDELLKMAKFEDFALINSDTFIASSEYDLPAISGLGGFDKVNFLQSEIIKLNATVNMDKDIENSTKSLVSASLSKTAKTVAEAEYYAFSNGAFITDNNTLDSEIVKVDTMIDKVKAQKTVNATRVLDQKESIDALAKSLMIVINDKGEIINGGTYVTELFNQLYNRHSKLMDEKAMLGNTLAQYENQKLILDKFKTDGFTTPSKEVVDKANAKLQMAFNDVKTVAAAVEKVLGGLDDGNSSGMKIAMAPVHAYELTFDVSWIKCILISAIIGILIGLTVAYPLDKKIKRKKADKTKVLLAETVGDVMDKDVNNNNDNQNLGDKKE